MRGSKAKDNSRAPAERIRETKRFLVLVLLVIFANELRSPAEAHQLLKTASDKGAKSSAARIDKHQREVNRRDNNKRQITVADVIGMTTIADPGYFAGGSSLGKVAQFSPDGKHFVVVIKTGNLQANTVDYSILLWHTDQALRKSSYEQVLTMSSSSNREAIAHLEWCEDNETLTFLGENPGELRQLYKFNTRTHLLTKLTAHPTNVMSYSQDATSDTIAYVAEAPAASLWNDKTKHDGLVVSRESVSDLINGKQGYDLRDAEAELFVLDARGTRRLNCVGKVHASVSTPYLSPGGQLIAIATRVQDIPEKWKEYRSDAIRGAIKATAFDPVTTLQRYEIVSSASGVARVLLNSPLRSGQAVWLPDGNSIILADVFLPLSDVTPDDKAKRENRTFTVEVDIATGRITTISDGKITMSARWESDNNVLRLATYVDGDWQTVLFHKKRDTWEKVSEVGVSAQIPDIVLNEDMNTAPTIWLRDLQRGQSRELLDLNPDFRSLAFGKVEEVRWKGSDGHRVKGGLYYPVGYQQGKRYPLVIQTHLWTSSKFWIDGPWSTAFAAQPLAGAGIMVLQADEGPIEFDAQRQEVEREVSTFEGAVDYLDRRGLIDRSRVGLVGFSRTCFFVKYALTHSRYHFAAASVTEGEDGGYLQFITKNNYFVDADSLYGGPPFGKALKNWIKLSPGFNVFKNHTPLLITVLNPKFLLVDWEWFEALTRLKRTVEMIMMQDGTHLLHRPSDRMISLQGNVDWFVFWLTGTEDPDPRKAVQYTRWRRMRSRQ